MPAADEFSIRFLGAAGTVTGSRYLVEAADTRLLVDCGLFQGGRELRERNWEEIPHAAETVDAVLLTHAHIDHSGYLPRLVKNGWAGRIVSTTGTADLCQLLLPDSGFLQEKDADFSNHRGFSRHKPALPLYTQDDAKLALEYFAPVDFETEQELADSTRFKFRRAGHILGASFIELTTGSRKVTFSGDLGRYDDPVMKDPEVPLETDYLVLESTYGNRLHERVDAMEALGEAIEKCIERRGTVVIPAFAVGRAQTLLFHLSRLRKAGRLRGVPVYLDSPMAISASKIFCRHLGDHRLTPEQCEETCDVPQYVRDVETSKQISRSHEPKIIISASGMATGGRVVHHIKQFAPDPRNLILFAGFQAAGTRGARMVEGARSLKIHGEQIPLNAEVANLPMLSGHADADEIMRWISAIKKPPRMTFITHGEPTASEALRQRIEKELGWKCKIPVQGERAILA